MNISDYFVKILRWGIYASLFLPLVIFSQYLSPFHFGKMIIFRILVELMLVFYILLIVTDKQYRPRWTAIVMSFSIFTALYIFTGIIGVNFYNSLWGSLERMGGIFSFIHYWVYFIILISIIKTEVDWNKIFKISVLVGFLSILFAYGQHFELGNFFVGWQHGERVIGTIGNPALFAGYLLFILFLALLMFLRNKGWKKWFFAAVFVLGVPVLLITAVRGAVIAFIGSMFLLGLFWLFSASNKKIKAYLLVAIVIFIILISVIWINRNNEWVKNIDWLKRITEISLSTSTVQTRLWAWTSAIDGWKEKPIFGWGPENFMYLHMKYFNPLHFTGMGAETIWDRAHNMVLEVLSTMGVVGLLSYLSIFFFLFYYLFKKYKSGLINKETVSIISAMIIAYFVQNLFIFDTFANYFMFFLILGYVNFVSLKKENAISGSAEDSVQIKKEPSIFFTAVLLVFAGIVAFQTNIKPAEANFSCTRAILAGRAGDANKALQYYVKALNFKASQGLYEIRNKLAAFAIEVVQTQAAHNQKSDPSLLNFSIDQVEKNVEKYPMDTTPYLYLARMYILLSGKDESAGQSAENYVAKAITLNDKNPRIWYEMGQAQLSEGKYQEGYQSFKKALDLNPAVNISYWFVSSAAASMGNYQDAAVYLDKALGMGYSDYKSNLSDILKMIKIYNEVGDYPRIVDLYKIAISLQPQNAQFHASIAVVYAKIGNFPKAIQEAQMAANIDPSFKDESQKFINSLK